MNTRRSTPRRSFGGSAWPPDYASVASASGSCCPALAGGRRMVSRPAFARGAQTRATAGGAMSDRRLSFVIPARNEEALIGETLEAILASVARVAGVPRHKLWLPDTPFDVLVADDGSEDATADIVGSSPTTPACDWSVRWRDVRHGAQRRRRGQLRACALLRRRRHHRSGERRRADPAAPRRGRPVPRALSARLSRAGDSRVDVVDFLGPRATSSAGEGQVHAGVHELRSRALRDLRPLRRGFRDRRGMAADRRGLPVSPRAIPLRPKPHRAHVQPANGASTVRLPANISRVDLGRALPLGAHLADRSHSTPEERSLMPARAPTSAVCRSRQAVRSGVLEDSDRR